MENTYDDEVEITSLADDGGKRRFLNVRTNEIREELSKRVERITTGGERIAAEVRA